MTGSPPLALFVGLPGLSLTANERSFFRDANPYGLFLFRRNLEAPEQIRRLCAEFREAVGRPDAPVFIDQEGGRVQRLTAGHWPSFRSLGDFGRLARKDLGAARRALRLSTHAMATILADLTIDSGTTPVVDRNIAETHGVIGDRAFGGDVELIVTLAREVIDGMLETGLLPVIKHIPGYGRVEVDPHFQCPVVDAELDDLHLTDFRPFLQLKDAPWAMVAHLVLRAVDADNPASVSPAVCSLIREEIGYDGVLITDCLTMEALSGSGAERVTRCLDAGYDLALHSQGDLAAMMAAADAARPLTDASLVRLARAEARRMASRVDAVAAHAEAESVFQQFGLA